VRKAKGSNGSLKCGWKNVLQINGAYTWMTECGRCVTIWGTEPEKVCKCGKAVNNVREWKIFG